MSTRTHNRCCFYKYASLDTARRIVESKQFRWCAPGKFNDPFDHQSKFVLDFTPESFADALTAAIERVVFSDDPPAVTFTSSLAVVNEQLRRIRDRLPKELVLKQLRETALLTAQNIGPLLDKMNAEIQEELCHSRVFCVSETNDNVVMWSHYADEHRGVVFQLGCVDAIDNSLLIARPVQYSRTFLSFPSAEQYARHLTGEAPLDMVELIWNLAYVKQMDWAYEREWRVHVPLLNEPPGDGVSYYADNPRVFEAIFLGCRMKVADQLAFVELIKQHLPQTRIYRSSLSSSAFELVFDPVL